MSDADDTAAISPFLTNTSNILGTFKVSFAFYKPNKYFSLFFSSNDDK